MSWNAAAARADTFARARVSRAILAPPPAGRPPSRRASRLQRPELVDPAAGRRLALISAIAAARDSRVITYFLSDRVGLQAQMADDAVRTLYEHVIAAGASSRIDLFLHSAGGSLDVPWRIATMLREAAPHVAVLVPYKALSAATLLCLAADEIVMGPKAELGPFDPQLTFQHTTGRRVVDQQLGLEDVSAYLHFMRRRVGISDPVALGAPLAEELPCTLLGEVERTRANVRTLARKLIALRATRCDAAAVGAVVRSLAGWSRQHGHAIVRAEARELGLPVVEPPAALARDLWALYVEYEELCRQRTPFDPETFLDGADEREARVVVGCIESRERADHLTGTLRVRRRRRVPHHLSLTINVSLGRSLDDARAELGKELEERVRQLLREEARRQGVTVGFGTSLVNEWTGVEGWAHAARRSTDRVAAR